jgi:hypothetical protein
MMKRDLRYSRRNLLKGIGAGFALLPLLEADKADAACVSGGIKRMYILAWPNGMLSSIDSWATYGATAGSWALAPFQGGISGTGGLTPYTSDLLLVNGIDYTFIQSMSGSGERTGHACFPGMLTGAPYDSFSSSTDSDTAGYQSIDRYIGKQVKASGGVVSLNQGAFVHSTGHLSWDGPGQVVLPTTDPTTIFNTYFKGAITTTPTPATTATATATATAAAPPAVTPESASVQKSILDYVIADLNRYSKIVGTADQQSIDQHLTYVRNIETRLAMANVGPTIGAMGSNGVITSGTGSACTAPTVASTYGGTGSTVDANIPMIAQLQMELGVAAFAADLTRVVVMQIGDQAGSTMILSWLTSAAGTPYAAGGPNPGDANTGDVNAYHAISHRNVADKVICDKWFQDQLGYVIGLMKSISDPTGATMLDSSVVVGMSNMRTGTHETTNLGWALAGSCGGYFKLGRSIQAPSGTSNNSILVALVNAMGAGPITTYGGTAGAAYGTELLALSSTT